MARCLHLDSRGRRCPQLFEAGRTFCPQHDAAEADTPLHSDAFRRLVFRLVAFFLVLALLLPLAVEGYRLAKMLFN